MGQSTNGQICYGIAFEEGFEFPWVGEDGEADIQDWWTYHVNGFKHEFELYDEAGNHLPGKRPPSAEDLEKYYGPKRAFEKANPLPVKLVNYCSGDCEMYILAVPTSFKMARRGYPEAFDPGDLVVTDEQKAALLKFCADHSIQIREEPKWYLSSLWM